MAPQNVIAVIFDFDDTLPVQIIAHLDTLIQTGLYGNSRTEAAVHLIRDQIIQLRKEGQLKKDSR